MLLMLTESSNFNYSELEPLHVKEIQTIPYGNPIIFYCEK